jgi:hypothetical protein
VLVAGTSTSAQPAAESLCSASSADPARWPYDVVIWRQAHYGRIGANLARASSGDGNCAAGCPIERRAFGRDRWMRALNPLGEGMLPECISGSWP